jgi:hypothetical protein
MYQVRLDSAGENRKRLGMTVYYQTQIFWPELEMGFLTECCSFSSEQAPIGVPCTDDKDEWRI